MTARVPADGPYLARVLSAARARNPVACAELDRYVSALLDELDARQGNGRADDFRARMDAFLARHPANPLPVPASPVAPPAPYQDPDDDEETADAA